MVGKCVKLILILALVVAVAFGVSFLPFSLSDKFKEVAEKVTSKIRDLANMGQTTASGVQLDFSKRENYKFGEFNVVLERTENEPKSGFVKFIHKGENDFVLPVNKFLNGETELTGLETGDFDFAAAFFKGNLPHLVMIELRKHGEKAATEEEELDEEDALSWFFVPGENNGWVKLDAGVDRARKAEEVLARLIEEAEAKAPAVPATPAARKGTKKAAVAAKAPAPAKKAAKAPAPKAKVVKVVEPEEDDGEELEFDEDEEDEEEEGSEEEDAEEDEEEEEEEVVEVLPPKPAAKKAAAKSAHMKTKAAKKPAAPVTKSELEETPEEFSASGNLRGQGTDSSLGSTVDAGMAA